MHHCDAFAGFVCNSNTSAFLLYNITDDQGESNPIIGHAESPGSQENALVRKVVPSAAANRAMKIILAQMAEAHVDNEFWSVPCQHNHWRARATTKTTTAITTHNGYRTIVVGGSKQRQQGGAAVQQ